MTEFTQYKLRMPTDLHRRLSDAADRGNRSISAEVMLRLEQSFQQPEVPFSTRITELLMEADRLDRMEKFLTRTAEKLSAELESGAEASIPTWLIDAQAVPLDEIVRYVLETAEEVRMKRHEKHTELGRLMFAFNRPDWKGTREDAINAHADFSKAVSAGHKKETQEEREERYARLIAKLPPPAEDEAIGEIAKKIKKKRS